MQSRKQTAEYQTKKSEKKEEKKKKNSTLGLMESRVTGRDEEESEADISEVLEEDKRRDEKTEAVEKGGRRERKGRFL